MQKEFAEAWLNRDDHKVYGRRLKPFCLRHLFYMALFQNATYLANSDDRSALLQAVLICSSSHEDLEKGRLSLTGWRQSLWIRGCFMWDNRIELAKWKAYIADFDARPEFWQGEEGGGARAPGVLAVATFIEQHSNMMEKEIMEAPIGKMFWKSATIAELNGLSSAQLITDEESEFMKEMEAEKANGK